MALRCLVTLFYLSTVICALNFEHASIRTTSIPQQAAHEASKGHMLLVFHFAALRFDKLSHDDGAMKAFKSEVTERLEVGIKAAAVANGTEFTKTKVQVTDVAVSDPSWDYDNDEHDYDDSITPPSRHHRNRPPPIDSTSTILVAKATVSGRNDLQAMKAFRLRLFNVPSEVFGSPDDPFVQKYGVPDCLDATLHVGSENSLDAEVDGMARDSDGMTHDSDDVDAKGRGFSSVISAFDDSDNDSGSDVGGSLEGAPLVAWTKIALGMLGLLVLSSILFATLATALAPSVSQAYAMADVWDMLDDEAPELE